LTPFSRQPVHVLYGGAHLFRAGIAQRAGEVALQALDQHGYPLPLPEGVEAKLRRKLAAEPVEDFRIDFEDGFGVRSDAEEDEHARNAATVISTALNLPRRIGVRLRPLRGATEARARRTLEIFLEKLRWRAPADFVFTLPKVESAVEVGSLIALLRDFPSIRVELMIETPPALRAIPELVFACEGRCAGLHFGAYDFLSACGVSLPTVTLRHPLCDFARSSMVVATAGMGVPVADGVTNLLPAGDSKQVHASWKLHADCVRHALMSGIYQGWDIHPAQLVSRYAAVYTFFAENAASAARRLKNFAERARQATRIGAQFDDAATVEGLKNFFARGVACGALTAEEAQEMTACDFSAYSR
jgi:citrate lyase beta subunit